MQGSGVLFNPNGQKALEAIDADLLKRYIRRCCQPGQFHATWSNSNVVAQLCSCADNAHCKTLYWICWLCCIRGSVSVTPASSYSAVPHCRFKAHSVRPETYVTYNLEGDEVRRATKLHEDELVKKYGNGPFFLGWHEIRQIIFDSLPSGVVEFNKQVSVVPPVSACPWYTDTTSSPHGVVAVSSMLLCGV